MLIDRIIAKFDKIDENLALIRDHCPQKYEEFQKMGLVKDGIYKRLEYSIELLMDIIAMVNSEMKFGIPNGTPDIIEKLLKNNFITEKTGKLLKSMKSLRNILVHVYGEVDDEIIFEIVNEKLDDFDAVKTVIMKKCAELGWDKKPGE